MSSKEMKKIINLLEDAQINESETFVVPKGNSFGVYHKTLNKWWDPKKGWSDGLTVWKARGIPTLVGLTNLTSYVKKETPGTIVVVDIFTGQHAPQFDAKIKKEYDEWQVWLANPEHQKYRSSDSF